MAYSKDSKSAAVRAKLGHPVIDGDGHWLEPVPIFLDFPRDVGGPSAVEKFMKKAKDTSWYEMAPAERMERRPHRPTWWGEPGNTLDRATAMVPRLFYERLDDFGIDFALVYKYEKVSDGSTSIGGAGNAGSSYSLGGVNGKTEGTFNEVGVYVSYRF